MKQNELLPLYRMDETEISNIQFELLDMTDFFDSNGNHPFEAHLHGFYQIIWFKKGCGSHYVDFEEYAVQDNSMFFLSPGQIHFFDKKHRPEGVILHFNESFLSDEDIS